MIARSISEYLSIVKDISIETDLINWYRGHADESWLLKPSIWREFSTEEERGMNHEFLWKAKARTSNPPQDKDWAGWLSLMQHYGLPTRLLDWSKSPLIALYFALDKFHLSSKKIENETNATVWVLQPGTLNITSGMEPYIFSINNSTARSMIEPAFLNPKDVIENEKIIAVSAIETDLRMIVQQSAFTVHSSQIDLNHYPGNETFLKKIYLPMESLPEISYELDVLGFKPSNIYPDLGYLAKETRKRYEGFAMSRKRLSP